MQKNQNSSIDETSIAPSNFEEFPKDHHFSVQYEPVYYNNDEDEFLPDMWENWLKITSYLPSSACIPTLPNLSSQNSVNSLPNSNTSSPAAVETSFIQHSPLSSEAFPYAAHEHDLHSLFENNNVYDHLDTRMRTQMAPYPPPLWMSLTALVSPPPLDLKARAGQPLLYLKARASSHKMKTAGAIKNFRNNGARKNKESKTILVESTEDGYVWRKYGQKSIKNRMHPRGYFKCAQPKCPVKKQTELSSDMQGFLLITYFGKHNHSAPILELREV